MPAVRGHPRQVVRVTARRFVRHGDADHVDVSQTGVRIAAIEGQVGRVRLETRIPGGERGPGRSFAHDHVRTGVARAERHSIPLRAPEGARIEVEPGVVDAFAGVEAVRDQHDHVLLARLQVRRGVLPDVDGELVESDPVRGAIGVDRSGKSLQQGRPSRLRVTPRGMAEKPDAPAPDPGHRDPRRSERESGALGGVLTDRPTGAAVLRSLEAPEGREAPMHEGFTRGRLQIADHRPDHVLGGREPASAPHPDPHGLRGVEQDPDPRADGGAHDPERVPAFVEGVLDGAPPGTRQGDRRRGGGEQQRQQQSEPRIATWRVMESLHGLSPFTGALVPLTATPGGPRAGGVASPSSSGRRCSRRLPVPASRDAERAAGSVRSG